MRPFVLFALCLAPLQAEYLRIEMGFSGMECASCTRFIENKFAKIAGVEKVTLDPVKRLLVLQLRPGNKVRISQVRDFVQQSGFKPSDPNVVAQGVPEVTRGVTDLKLDEAGTAIRVKDDGAVLRELIRKRVEISGVVKIVSSGGNTLEVLHIEKAKLIESSKV